MQFSRERKVGLMMLTTLVVFGALVVFLGRIRVNAPGYPVRVSFNYVDAMRSDAPVLYGGGVKVGVVDRLSLEEGKVQVHLHLYRGTRIPRDSSVSIHTSGILGEKYVQISPGNLQSGEWQAGERVNGIDPGSLDRTLQRIEILSDFFAPLLADSKFKGSFAAAIGHFERLGSELSRLVAGSSGDIQESVRNLKEFSAGLRQRSRELKEIAESAREMVNEKNRKTLERSLSALDTTLAKLDHATAQLEAQKGLLGVLVYDEKAGQDLRDILNDLKRHPWKLLWKK